MKILLPIFAVLLGLTPVGVRAQSNAPAPVRYAIIGLEHDHARGFIPGATKRTDVQLVGIVDDDPQLIAQYATRYHLPTNLFFPSLEALLAKTNVQAVALFTSTFDHERYTEEAAAHHLDVMMEKPLAVNMKAARAMAAAAKKNGVKIFVNYETTWYPGNQAAYHLVHDQNLIGDLRKIVVHDGHQGPKEIGCSTNFLAWLTDPVLDGGGALMDFGCYGADLMTWLMNGERPTSVTAVTQHIKPDVYPKVEDEATIVVTYPKAQGIIQASWNWPYNRKDMEVYGRTGYILVPHSDELRVLTAQHPEDTAMTPPELTGPESNPLSYLAAVVRGDIQPAGLSSLDVNITVVEILDAARESARTGHRIDLPASRE